MASDTLTELLKLPPSDRADLALALWECLDDASRGDVTVRAAERIASGPTIQGAVEGRL